MISGFLIDIWKQGGLKGPTATAAFHVAVGPGSTMTEEDVLKGVIRVMVQIALVRPAEFL